MVFSFKNTVEGTCYHWWLYADDKIGAKEKHFLPVLFQNHKGILIFAFMIYLNFIDLFNAISLPLALVPAH